MTIFRGIALLALGFAASGCDSKAASPPVPPAGGPGVNVSPITRSIRTGPLDPSKSKKFDVEVIGEIRDCLREGCYSRDRLVEIFCEEKYLKGELDPKVVRETVDRELAALREEQKSWPKETDCDRLSQVFQALNSIGVIALENAGFDQGEGYEAVTKAMKNAREKEKISGYCFYHNQDLERAVKGQGLYVAFGPIDPEKEETAGPQVGKLVVQELERRGFKVKWNGKFNERIFIEKLDLKKRI